MEVAALLKIHRENAGLSQHFVAEHLHVSRQSISKWENGRGYPDLNNLILLSELYKVSIDELIRENKQLKEKIEENTEQIEDKKQKLQFINKQIEKESDEGLILLAIAAIASFITPLGFIIVPFIIWRNKASNSLYKVVYIVSICALLSNIYGGYAHFVNITNYRDAIEVNIQKIDDE